MTAGGAVYPDPDFVMLHDGVVMGAKRELDSLGIDRLAAPEKVVMVTDHDVIYGSARAAERGAFNREAARRWGVKTFFDVVLVQSGATIYEITFSSLVSPIPSSFEHGVPLIISRRIPRRRPAA